LHLEVISDDYDRLYGAEILEPAGKHEDHPGQDEPIEREQSIAFYRREDSIFGGAPCTDSEGFNGYKHSESI